MKKYAQALKAQGGKLEGLHAAAETTLTMFDYESLLKAVELGHPDPTAGPLAVRSYRVAKQRVKIRSISGGDKALLKESESWPKDWVAKPDATTGLLQVGAAAHWVEGTAQPPVSGFLDASRLYLVGYRETRGEPSDSGRQEQTWDMRPDPQIPGPVARNQHAHSLADSRTQGRARASCDLRRGVGHAPHGNLPRDPRRGPVHPGETRIVTRPPGALCAGCSSMTRARCAMVGGSSNSPLSSASWATVPPPWSAFGRRPGRAFFRAAGSTSSSALGSPGSASGRRGPPWPRSASASIGASSSRIALGTLGGLALMLATAGLIRGLGGFHWVRTPGTGPADLAAGAWFFLAVACFEELLFRGYAFQRAVRGLGFAAAQILFALIFAWVHWDNPGMQGPPGPGPR